MTREEAIDIIQSILDKYEEDECLVTEITIGDEDIEALKLAIKALEQEQTTKNDLGVDCISRADVIDRVITYFDHIKKDNDEWSKGYETGTEDAISVIKSTPTVTQKEPILDKIRAEIEQMDFDFGDFYDHTYSIREMVLKVFDKYKAESEG